MAQAAGLEPKDYVAKAFKSGELQMACEDPDHPDNWPRNMFVWRSNLLGSSGKGHEYFLKHLLGTTHGVQGKDLGETCRKKPKEIAWDDNAPKGKLDLLVTHVDYHAHDRRIRFGLQPASTKIEGEVEEGRRYREPVVCPSVIWPMLPLVAKKRRELGIDTGRGRRRPGPRRQNRGRAAVARAGPAVR